MKTLLCLVLTACIHLPHIDPAPREHVDALLTAVELDVWCGDIASGGRSGSGVIISERHVLTAYHLVKCAEIPTVKAHYTNASGEHTLTLVVTREDPDADIARLEIFSAEHFRAEIAPPALGDAVSNEMACAYPSGTQHYQAVCGVVSSDATLVRGMATVHGDSGAGVYASGLSLDDGGQYTGKGGKLIGIVVRAADDGSYTRIAPVDASWLEGT
jgi:hypothetical protein